MTSSRMTSSFNFASLMMYLLMTSLIDVTSSTSNNSGIYNDSLDHSLKDIAKKGARFQLSDNIDSGASKSTPSKDDDDTDGNDDEEDVLKRLSRVPGEIKYKSSNTIGKPSKIGDLNKTKSKPNSTTVGKYTASNVNKIQPPDKEPDKFKDDNEDDEDDVREISEEQLRVHCSRIRCKNGGLCIRDRLRTGSIVRCQCPLGSTGEQCEKFVAVRYPRFLGDGYMAFARPYNAYRQLSIDVVFRPDTNNGLLLFSSNRPDAIFDFFSVTLVNGRAELRFDCGSGMAMATTSNSVQLGRWNNITVHRYDQSGSIKLNDGPESKRKSKPLSNIYRVGWTAAYDSHDRNHVRGKTRAGGEDLELQVLRAPTLTRLGSIIRPGSSSRNHSNWSGKQQWKNIKRYSQLPNGTPKGRMMEIGLKEDFYLGGYRNNSLIGSRTGMSWGFVGCVSYLAINGHVYDMRKGAFVGDALHGADVGECSEHVCDNVRCYNDGTCAAAAPDKFICLCPLGTAGQYCESKIDAMMPRFDGHSFLQYNGLKRSVLTHANIEIVFEAHDPDGLILYNGYSTDRIGDFIAISLRAGYLEFRFDLGTGAAVIRSEHTLPLHQWHTVRVSRTGRVGQLQVNDESPVTGQSRGAFTQLTLVLDLFLGGHRNFDETARSADVTRSFKGCVQKVTINERTLKLLDEALDGINVENCDHACSSQSQPCRNGGHCVPQLTSYRCVCPAGFDDVNCQSKTARYRYRYRYKRDESS